MKKSILHIFYQGGFFIMAKKLVAYFSASGTTKRVAEITTHSWR